MNDSQELQFAKSMALEAGEVMRSYFRKENHIVIKPDKTPVTEADIKINELVIKRVKTTFPDHGVLGEEKSFKPDRRYIWVVDPIDGTAPFSLEIPISTFCLALVDRNDGQPVVGVIFDPFLDKLFYAENGLGAYMNGTKIKTSKLKTIENSYVSATGISLKKNDIHINSGETLQKFFKKRVTNFTFSSGAYLTTKVADGSLTCVVMMNNGLPWDTAAPVLIVKEAGGQICDLKGNVRRFDTTGDGCILAANNDIKEELLKLLNENQ